MAAIDYNKRQHLHYHNARVMSPDTAALWMNAIEQRVAIHPDNLVLDLGSGTGRFSILIADHFGVNLIGVEPSEKMRGVAEAQNGHPGITYVKGRAEEIPVEDGSVTLAWLSMMVHHVEDFHACARELFRVLKPDGVVLIRNNFTENMDNAKLYEFFPEALKVDLERFPSIQRMQHVFEGNGFRMASPEVIEQIIDASLADHLDRVRHRVYSGLELISDAEFEEGLKRMESAVENEKQPQPVLDYVDLLRFEKK